MLFASKCKPRLAGYGWVPHRDCLAQATVHKPTIHAETQRGILSSSLRLQITLFRQHSHNISSFIQTCHVRQTYAGSNTLGSQFSHPLRVLYGNRRGIETCSKLRSACTCIAHRIRILASLEMGQLVAEGNDLDVEWNIVPRNADT